MRASSIEARVCGLIDARGEAPWRVVGGITLVTRLVRGFELAGLERIVVVCDRPVEPEALEAVRDETRLAVQLLRPGAPLAEAAAELPEESELLVAEGSLVVDLRLQAALARSSAPTMVPCPERAAVRLARLSAEQLGAYGEAPDPALGWRTLEPESLDTWSAKLRGHQEILLLDAASPEVAARAETQLIQRTQKLVMDWPARWIDPHFESAIVRWLAPTRVGPDAVTWFGAAIALVGAALLYKGWLIASIPFMLLTGWLDGVDGKLVRLRLKGGWVGDAESLVDFVLENSWYVALAAWFHGAGMGDSAIWVWAVLAVGNAIDECSYFLAEILLGGTLDLLSAADGAFRLVAGRRNVYVWYLTVAFLTGFAWEGFVLCAVWAILTGLTHAVRLVMELRARRARSETLPTPQRGRNRARTRSAGSSGCRSGAGRPARGASCGRPGTSRRTRSRGIPDRECFPSRGARR